MVGQLALEVLARDGADLRRAVGLDRDVDRLPPLGVGAPVGERVEDGLAAARATSHSSTKTYSPAVRSPIDASPSTAPANAFCTRDRRPRRVPLLLELGDHPRGRDRLQQAALRDLPVAVELGEPLQELLGAQRRPQLDAHVALARAGGEMPVRRAGRRRRTSRRRRRPACSRRARDRRARDHLLPLLLARMHVGLRDEPARPADHVVLEQLAAVSADVCRNTILMPRLGSSSTSPVCATRGLLSATARVYDGQAAARVGPRLQDFAANMGRPLDRLLRRASRSTRSRSGSRTASSAASTSRASGPTSSARSCSASRTRSSSRSSRS